MDERGQLLGERALRGPRLRSPGGQGVELLELGAAAEAEGPQVPRHVTVVRAEPELVEGVRRGHRRVEPHRPGLGLAELRAVGLGQQDGGQGVHGRAGRLADQLGAGREVAPLVAAARLQGAAVAPVQLEVVHALQDLVAELGVADTALAVQPRADRLLGDHAPDAEVPADVAQQVDRRQPGGPVEVVDHDGCLVPREVEVRLDLRPDALDPGRDDVGVVELALRRRLGVADQAGRAADERQRSVAGELEAPQRQDLHEVADVQRRRGRVEAAVVGDGPGGQVLAQRLEVGRLGQQAAPRQVVQHTGPRGGRPRERRARHTTSEDVPVVGRRGQGGDIGRGAVGRGAGRAGCRVGAGHRTILPYGRAAAVPPPVTGGRPGRLTAGRTGTDGQAAG